MEAPHLLRFRILRHAKVLTRAKMCRSMQSLNGTSNKAELCIVCILVNKDIYIIPRNLFARCAYTLIRDRIKIHRYSVAAAHKTTNDVQQRSEKYFIKSAAACILVLSSSILWKIGFPIKNSRRKIRAE